MREYKDTITLRKNSRGTYELDPSKGCSSGVENNANGCYGDCYAARSAKIYGYDFGKTILRYFKSEAHLLSIKNKIKQIELPFIRMGAMCDPSENWEHTISICEKIQIDRQMSLFPTGKKEVVIITKHWANLTDNQLCRLTPLNICINTSVSALDKQEILDNSIKQYERIKPYCKSILRIVSCNFNLQNTPGRRLHNIQKDIFDRYNVLDTVLRISPKNNLVRSGVVVVKKSKFLGKGCYVSKYNRKTYFGKCDTCLEMCGVKMKT